jgi:fumarylacetoacetate (FAA) hydrolase
MVAAGRRSIDPPEAFPLSFAPHRMKLATVDDGSRDGHLVVVSRDLALAHHATAIARTMRALLDDWNFLSPQLEDLYATLNDGKARHAFAFEARLCRPPLPRASRFVLAVPGDGDGFTLQEQAADSLAVSADEAVTAGWAVVTGDIAAGCDADTALEGVRLLLRTAGPVAHPVACTADEAGAAWRDEQRAFGRWIAQAAQARGLGAGSLVGGMARAA